MIRIVEDVVAPGAVAAVDILTLEVAPEANEWAAYGMAAIGYVGAAMRMGGQFVNNIGHAAFPLAARNVYARIKATQGTSRRASSAGARMALKNVSSNPGNQVGRAYQPEFDQAGAHAY